ncbi:MAG: DMT family transporter [Phyllobacteriaceae bacterium]|nr:DMT family transporter [Phyllobacteriaceae bacterium]
METWVVITIAAAFLQNLRSALQKHLKGVMGTTGATFVRFGFGAPFALAYLAILHFGVGRPLPTVTVEFLAWAILGGIAQITATGLLIHLFSLRNFAVGTAYSRTEPVQAALFALMFLGETITLGVAAAIVISVTGVMLIAVARSVGRAFLAAFKSRDAAIGLLSGAGFGVAAVAYRMASLALGRTLVAPDYMTQAAMTLAVVILFQSLLMLAWMAWREPDEFPRIVSAWKPSLLVGLVGATASFGWFMAMTLQQAAIVKALAQIEMLFTYASAVLVFREHVNARELAGCVLVAFGVVVLLYLG